MHKIVNFSSDSRLENALDPKDPWKDSSTENFRFESLKSPSFTDSLGPTAD